MKKARHHIFASLLGAIPIFLLLGLMWLQTPQATHWIKGQIERSASERGLELSIDHLSGGFLPIDWRFEGVEAHWNGEAITFDTLQARIGLFSLLRQDLDITYLKGTGGNYMGRDLSFCTALRLDLRGKKSTKINHFLLEGDQLFVRFDGKVDRNWIPKKGFLSFSLPEAELLTQKLVSGKLKGSAFFHDGKAEATLMGQDLSIDDLPLAPTTLSLTAEKVRHTWEGHLTFLGGHRDVSLKGEARIEAPESLRRIQVKSLSFEAPDANLFGHLSYNRTRNTLKGALLGQCNDLRAFRPLLPSSMLKGQLGFKVDFDAHGEKQGVSVQLEVDNMEAFDASCSHFLAEATLLDLFGDLRGSCTIEGHNLERDETRLSMVEFKTNIDPHSSPYSVLIEGSPVSLSTKGDWQKRGKGIYIHFDELKGKAYAKTFHLNEPFFLDWNAHQFKMSNCSVDIGNGGLFARIDLSPTTSLIKVQGKELPLELVPLPGKYFSLQGIGEIDIDLVSWEDNIQGTCRALVKRAHVLSVGGDDPLTTKGSLQIHLSDSRAQIHGELKAKGGQFVHSFGSVPICYQHFPFRLSIDKEKPITGQVMGEGKLEDLFNFINIGSQRVEGWLSTQLYLSKTLQSPALQGTFEWQDGVYENYYTGTLLKGIEAKGRACQQTLLINELIANDGKEGTVFATGSCQLSPSDHFPFTLTGELDNLTTVSFDMITGKFSGDVTISGNSLGATARGTLNVVDATMQIPDELPTALPALPVTFVNPPERLASRKAPPPPASPLLLDLNIQAPGNIFVEGRGLQSELKGDLHLTGTYADIAASGTLQLLKGEFLFSGKVFSLTSGELIFQDKPTPSSFISLSGTCDLPDVAVTVHLRGPLSEPKLSFQSSPSLPTSDLLSQILFNKDISEVSAVQALQVAQTVIALSGSNAPDILEKIRKTLGIDRLTLVTSENDPGNLSLQIGKYLMRGVLLTLSSGAKTKDLSVEVDLKKGFTFQAEVNEDQQRKFSLKWNHHY